MGHNSLNDDWREGRSRGWDELIDHSSGNKGCIVGSVIKHDTIWAFGLVGTSTTSRGSVPSNQD